MPFSINTNNSTTIATTASTTTTTNAITSTNIINTIGTTTTTTTTATATTTTAIINTATTNIGINTNGYTSRMQLKESGTIDDSAKIDVSIRSAAEVTSTMSKPAAPQFCCECIAAQNRCSSNSCPCFAARRMCDEHCESARFLIRFFVFTFFFWFRIYSLFLFYGKKKKDWREKGTLFFFFF